MASPEYGPVVEGAKEGRRKLEALNEALLSVGLNVAGCVDTSAYDRHVSGARRSQNLLRRARTILVVGSGGPAFWHHFLDALQAEPRRLSDNQHPVDVFARRAIETASAALGDTPHRWCWASAEAELHLDFRVLGRLAGLGSDSRLRLILHPVYGPWLGFRAACFLPFEVRIRQRDPVDFCIECHAPCVEACPGEAFAEGVWDVDACSSFHRASDLCADTCHARVACPVAAEHRYPPEEILYHYNRALGRARLRDRLQIENDEYEGVGPHWENWKDKPAPRELAGDGGPGSPTSSSLRSED